MRRPTLICLFLIAVKTLAAQENAKPTPFGCSAGAVQVSLKRNPPLHFARLPQPPGGIEFRNDHPPNRSFAFSRAEPFGIVNLYLSATLPEAVVGMSSGAQLNVYAETAHSADELGARNTQWWKLVAQEGATRDRFISSAETLCIQLPALGLAYLEQRKISLQRG